LYVALFVLHSLMGIGGLAGGGACLLNSENPAGAPLELLKNSPFKNFLIPGIILFTLVGIGNVSAAVLVLFHLKYQAYISGILGCILVGWIVVQCIMIKQINFMHVASFTIGLTLVVLSTIIAFKLRLYPTELVLKFFNKI
jgi:hypothetical protein